MILSFHISLVRINYLVKMKIIIIKWEQIILLTNSSNNNNKN